MTKPHLPSQRDFPPFVGEVLVLVRKVLDGPQRSAASSCGGRGAAYFRQLEPTLFVTAGEKAVASFGHPAAVGTAVFVAAVDFFVAVFVSGAQVFAASADFFTAVAAASRD